MPEPNTCPYCDNSDQDMLEELYTTMQGVMWLCGVCERVFRVTATGEIQAQPSPDPEDE